MNLAHHFKKYFVIFAASAISFTTVPATAGVKGSMIFDISNGCFSTTGSADDCGNVNEHAVFASGEFTFTDTLSPLNPSTQNYSYNALAELHAVDPNGVADPFDIVLEEFFGTFDALTGDPRWTAALGVFNSVVNGDPIIGPGGAFTINFSGTSTGNPTDPDGASGSFTAWSSDFDALNAFSGELLGRPLPEIPVLFTARAELNAVSEPISLALLGLGIVAMASTRRKHA